MDAKPDIKTYSSSKDLTGENKNNLDGRQNGTTTTVKAEVNEGTSFDVDIIASAIASNEKSDAAEDGDSTEYSSSFDGTESDTENFDGINETEVESTFFDHSTMANAFDALDCVFSSRKKKLTTQWRNFVHPLMWRCKWAELKIREMDSQLSKYSEELAACDQANFPELKEYASNDFGLRSQPYSDKFYEKKAMKRRKRKRAEHVMNVSSYMSGHNLFSYFAEHKRSGPDGSSMADEFNNSVITYQNDNDSDEFSISNDQLFLEVKGGDNSLESTLLKIERAQSQVQKLKSQLDMLILRHSVKIGSSENLSILEHTSSLPSLTISSANCDIITSRATCAPNQHIPEYDCADLVLPEGAVSSFLEASLIPDIIESTVGMLSATEVTAHQPHMGDSHETIVDNVLLRKEVSERERRACKTSSGNSETQKGELDSTDPASGHERAEKGIMYADLATPKPCLVSDFHFQNKRKRGERKAFSGSWSKRQSGEPDSQ